MPGLCERLLLGVKQSVSTCNFILGDSLQGAKNGQTIYSITIDLRGKEFILPILSPPIAIILNINYIFV